MSDLVKRNEVTPADLKRGRRLKIGAWTAPVILAAVPAIIFFILSLVTSGTPVFAVSAMVLGILLTLAGFITGLIISGILTYRRSKWTTEMRERIAANGIRAEEIEWFADELRSSEKRALKLIDASDELLADAYRETLASRLTATRIVRSSKREFQASKRRRSKVKQLHTESSKDFQEEIDRDIVTISNIHQQAKEMLTEAESRLQMIEASAVRGTRLADQELALKKLSMRSAELPLALEEAKASRELLDEFGIETAPSSENKKEPEM